MKGPVVCNAGPLIALALLNRLDVLNALHNRVLVPGIVYREVLTGGKHGTGLNALRAASGLEVITDSPPSDPLLSAMLDAGKAAVILLARAAGVAQIFMDERKGRKIARNIYGLSVKGTARLMIEAKTAGILNSVRTELETLQKLGYWLGDAIISEACRLAGE